MPDPDAPYPIDGWKLTYYAPGTCKNPTSYFKLPPTRQIIQNLRSCGGDPGDFLETVAPGDEKLQKLLLMQIYEKLSDKKNKKRLDEWTQIVATSDKVKLRMGLSKYLSHFKDKGDAKNTTLVSKLGTAALPEAFTEQKIRQNEQDSSKEKLDELTNSLGIE